VGSSNQKDNIEAQDIPTSPSAWPSLRLIHMFVMASQPLLSFFQ